MTILLVYQKREQFQSLLELFQEQDNVQLLEAGSAEEALKKMQEEKVQVLVCAQTLPDMEGVVFLKQLVKINPLVNTVLVSDLPGKEFHEVTEGLGVLMQLPSVMDREHGQAILDKLAKVASLF